MYYLSLSFVYKACMHPFEESLYRSFLFFIFFLFFFFFHFFFFFFFSFFYYFFFFMLYSYYSAITFFYYRFVPIFVIAFTTDDLVAAPLSWRQAHVTRSELAALMTLYAGR